MVVVPPATLPSTVVSPPSSPTSPADASVHGFESDLEKGQYDENRADYHDSKDCLLRSSSRLRPNKSFVLVG